MFVFALGAPSSEVRVTSLGVQAGLLEGTIVRVERLGLPTPLTYERGPAALVIQLPPDLPPAVVTGFAVRLAP